jgi:branched-chain amino acid transport system ATP-binding protein
MPSMLEVSGLSAGYGARPVLRDVNLTVQEGACVALLGANGAGKSTLLRAITGLVRPTQGTIMIAGANVTGAPAHRLARAGLLHIPEGRGIFRSLTVAENLRLFSSAPIGRDLLRRVFDYFPQLEARYRQPAWTLSGGEQQMVALARAIVSRPRLLLVDELSLGLAPVLVQELGRALIRLKEDGTTMLLVEENVRFVFSIAESVYVLKNGSIVFNASAAEARKEESAVITAYLSA